MGSYRRNEVAIPHLDLSKKTSLAYTRFGCTCKKFSAAQTPSLDHSVARNDQGTSPLDRRQWAYASETVCKPKFWSGYLGIFERTANTIIVIEAVRLCAFAPPSSPLDPIVSWLFLGA